MNLEENFSIKKFIIECIGTVIGAAIMAVGVSLFLLPNQLSSGGFTGIATITYYLFNWSMGTFILILNIPFFILAVYKLGKSFFIKSIIGTVSLSVIIDIFDRFQPLTHDKFLSCIYGGIIIGLGTSIILKMNSSTGGSELVSNIARGFNSTIKMGNIIMIMDTAIVTANVIVFKNIEVGLYSAIAIYIMGKIIDVVFEGVYFTKLLIIISNKNEDIAKEIGDKIKRGTTGLLGKGMYTKEEKLILLCAVSRGDVAKIRMMVNKIDPNSFMIITNSREVFGLGFKK